MLRRCGACRVLARNATPHIVCWHAMHTPRHTSCAGTQCSDAAMHTPHAMPHFMCWHAMHTPCRTSCAGTRCTCHASPRVLACNAPTLRCTCHTPCRTSCAGMQCHAAPHVLACDATPHLVCWHARPSRTLPAAGPCLSNVPMVIIFFRIHFRAPWGTEPYVRVLVYTFLATTNISFESGCI